MKLQPFASQGQTEGHLKTPQIAPELTEAARPTKILRQPYENPTTKHELHAVILDKALRAFPSGWQPAA